ncbi:MAG: hypothetical protein JWN48_4585 [Myxococcaceae bacterium]|nr:hypothetical protein [Myxococcaceae bacterium]
MRARSLTSLSLCSLLALAGCSELVPLGSACPESADSCLIDDDGGGSVATPDAQAPTSDDAGMAMLPASADDAAAQTSSDATVAVPSVRFPLLDNGGFDLRDMSSPGDVTTLSTTNIKPWYTCQPIGGPDNTTAVRAETMVTLADTELPAGATVLAPDGAGTFVSMQYLINIVPISLLQSLAGPLAPGEPYGFAIDVQSPNPSAKLSLQVRGTGDGDDCLNLGGNVLVESDPITTTGWQTLCLSFTATEAYTHLVLTPKSGAPLTGAITNAKARLLLDNLRAVTTAECPGL